MTFVVVVIVVAVVSDVKDKPSHRGRREGYPHRAGTPGWWGRGYSLIWPSLNPIAPL